jgi:phosphinothricin acetyltransferase
VAEAAIRPAEPSDLEALARIYDHYIVHSPITFDLEPFGTEGRRAWFEGFAPRGRHRLLVADGGDGALGYASSHTFRPKGAYATSVETSVYLDPEATGRGLGSRLYSALFDALESEDVHRAYGGVTLPNPASVALHRRFGFEYIGTYRQVGRKFERYWDVAWYEKQLR